MSDQNTSESKNPSWGKFWSIVIPGVFVTLGLGCIGFSIYSIRALLALNLPEKELIPKDIWFTFLAHLGVAFLLAGIASFTIERFNQEKNQRELKEAIDKLKNSADNKISAIETASQDSIISSLVPDKVIFDEIQQTLLRKNYILREYTYEFNLRWIDPEKKQLEKVTRISYFIHNITLREIKFKVRLKVETESAFEPKLRSYKFREEEKVNPDQKAEIDDEVVLEPGRNKLEYTFISHHEDTSEDPLVIPHPADSLMILVPTYPEEIEVSCYPLHPLIMEGETDIAEGFIYPKEGDQFRNRWKIQRGILPYQGMLISWKRKN